MIHLIIKTITAVILFSVLAPAGADHTVRIRTMSQNLYIGADLERLLAGEPPAAVLATVQQTNFPARAVEIARAIDAFRPDLIGLQEVSLITLFDTNGNVLLELDYLAILLDALAARGEHYTVASTINNADVTLPIDPAAGTFGRLLDRDVILARNRTTTTSNAVSANYTDNLVVDFGGFPLEFTRGYTAVDANVKGKDVRFVNTHLEVEDLPCVTSSGLQICQDLQSAELIKVIDDEKLPVVLVGDFNAEPGTTAYQTVADAGYIDTWTIRYPYNNEPGYTCCQAEDLTGPNQLSVRIDHIFVKDSDDFPIFSAITTVVGDWERRRTPDGLWYSDHGGPWAKLKTRR
ncbi:MAG: endonuclease/exonuclease/phosphatase family protein [Pseudomonadales bacterium]